MQIYEVRINDKKNEAKMFWFSSVEDRNRLKMDAQGKEERHNA